MDACMEVDGRVGEGSGNIYISKRISTWIQLLSVIMLHDLCVTVCVCSEGSALFHITSFGLYEKVHFVIVNFTGQTIYDDKSIGIYLT